jgi:hypothetical protein
LQSLFGAFLNKGRGEFKNATKQVFFSSGSSKIMWLFPPPPIVFLGVVYSLHLAAVTHALIAPAAVATIPPGGHTLRGSWREEVVRAGVERE